MIQSDELTLTAGVDPNVIEQASDQCIQAWCFKTGNSHAGVYRVCAMYLVPIQSGDLFQSLFNKLITGHNFSPKG